MSICLVLLVGIPCSGKTFFRTYLENYIKENVESVLGIVQMCSVCFDDYVKVRNPHCYLDETTWKEERFEVFKHVEYIISHFVENSQETSYKVTLINETIAKADCTLVLVDDNMYYRSMRYEYFKLAKEYSVSFCQIFFDVDLEKALKSNELRTYESKVPEFIIKSMFNKIEPPSMNHAWESNSVCIKSYADFCNELVTSDIFLCIKNALLNPVQSNEKDICLAREMSRVITNANALHKIDNALKQIVGVLIKENIKANTTQSHEIARILSSTRLNLLKQIKDGVALLPIDITKPIAEDDMDVIKPVLLDMIKKMM